MESLHFPETLIKLGIYFSNTFSDSPYTVFSLIKHPLSQHLYRKPTNSPHLQFLHTETNLVFKIANLFLLKLT